MTFHEYQRESARYVPFKPHLLAGLTLGLTGEAGEVAELVKKALYHDVPYSDEDMEKELGDVLWYLTAVARECGLSLADIAQQNLEKLRKRYPDGFVPGGGIR